MRAVNCIICSNLKGHSYESWNAYIRSSITSRSLFIGSKMVIDLVVKATKASIRFQMNGVKDERGKQDVQIECISAQQYEVRDLKLICLGQTYT